MKKILLLLCLSLITACSPMDNGSIEKADSLDLVASIFQDSYKNEQEIIMNDKFLLLADVDFDDLPIRKTVTQELKDDVEALIKYRESLLNNIKNEKMTVDEAYLGWKKVILNIISEKDAIAEKKLNDFIAENPSNAERIMTAYESYLWRLTNARRNLQEKVWKMRADFHIGAITKEEFFKEFKKAEKEFVTEVGKRSKEILKKLRGLKEYTNLSIYPTGMGEQERNRQREEISQRSKQYRESNQNFREGNFDQSQKLWKP